MTCTHREKEGEEEKGRKNGHMFNNDIVYFQSLYIFFKKV